MYIVVYRYTELASGRNGNRYPYAFDTVEDTWCADTFGLSIPIAQGIKLEDIFRYTCLTPEIARFTTAIEDSCLNSGRINTKALMENYLNAVRNVQIDRTLIQSHGLIRTDEFPAWTVESEVTEKDRLLSAVLATCTDIYGQVDLEAIDKAFNDTVKQILDARPPLSSMAFNILSDSDIEDSE